MMKNENTYKRQEYLLDLKRTVFVSDKYDGELITVVNKDSIFIIETHKRYHDTLNVIANGNILATFENLYACKAYLMFLEEISKD